MQQILRGGSIFKLLQKRLAFLPKASRLSYLHVLKIFGSKLAFYFMLRIFLKMPKNKSTKYFRMVNIFDMLFLLEMLYF